MASPALDAISHPRAGVLEQALHDVASVGLIVEHEHFETVEQAVQCSWHQVERLGHLLGRAPTCASGSRTLKTLPSPSPSLAASTSLRASRRDS